MFAFVLALGEVDDLKYAAAAGAINYGFPTIAETDIPQILPTGVCTYEHVCSDVALNEIVAKAIEVRGLKIVITEVPVPVAYGPAFEGERIRKEDLHVEMAGPKKPGCELTVIAEDVEDGKVTIVGPDIGEIEPGTTIPFGLLIEVSGRKMQKDFEPILERQLHHFLNEAEGFLHVGQRDIIWERINKKAVAAGFTFEHVGKIVHARYHSDFGGILDKVQVTVFTKEPEVSQLLERALETYKERDERLGSLTDEAVDIFYSCTLCQSFAPDHVCVITPERPGLCGAYNWLDGKAAFEINPTGPNQPINKGAVVDDIKGQWDGCQRVRLRLIPQRHRALQRVHHDGRPDDLLRVLRGDQRRPAHVQRHHDRRPGPHRDDPLRDEVLHPGRLGRRRGADPGVHRSLQVLPGLQQVHQRRRRSRPRGVDAQEAQRGA